MPHPGAVLNRNLGRGVGRLNKILTLFKTRKMEILLPCLRESAVISYPVQDWTKHYRIQNNKKLVHKFAFSPIQRSTRNQ